MSMKVLIIGRPNVGKSVLFNCLTGRYVTVSNYPGTTVEVARGQAHIGGAVFEVIDTPGTYGLIPLHEDEHVTRSILMNEPAALAVHVVEARNLQVSLPFTFELMESGHPTILVLNMMDELGRFSTKIETQSLANMLNVTVIPTVATRGVGIDALKKEIAKHARVA